MTDISLDSELENFGYKPTLSRTLTTRHLFSFGLIYLQPIGPAVIFGYLLAYTGGTVALPYLFAFIGMLFTVFSYSILIQEYPLAGSIYNYVKYICGPFFGFVAGWLLIIDYLLIPTITSVSAAIFAHQLLPSLSYKMWLCFFVFSMGFLSIRGIKFTSFVSNLLLLVQILVVLAGFVVWAHYIMGASNNIGSLFSIKPFHFGTITGVMGASSLAIFSFLGFDAVTTLAEESVSPRKDIPRAMMLCVSIGFLIMFVTGYLGVLAASDWKALINQPGWKDATLFNLAKLSGGDTFSVIYTCGFIIAMAVTNLVGTTAASRLLYGMGRDRRIPGSIFAKINKRWRTPYLGIVFIIIIELALGSYANQDQIAELINYGAISGFIILNCSLMIFGYKIYKEKIKLKWINIQNDNNVMFIIKFFALPAIGFLIMLLIFLSMKRFTLIFGTIWLLIGVAYYFLNNYSQKNITANH